jgi:predicted ATP-grasp superfamily ATP-dependent carboligase
MNTNSKKTILLLAISNSYRGGAFETAAHNLDFNIVWGHDLPSPSMVFSEGNLSLDYRDYEFSCEKIIAYAKKFPLDAILGLDDSGTIIAAKASGKIGLPHNNPTTSVLTRDKFQMRQAFENFDVPSPRFSLHSFSENLDELSLKVNYPAVLKPLTLSGSRGVMRVNSPTDFLTRVARLKPILAAERCNEFIIEDYIPGIEVAVEGLLDDGKFHVLAIFDKPDPLEGPFFEETIYVTPSRLSEKVQQEIITVAEQAAKSLGMTQGSVHAELRYNENGPWMVEIAGRSIGGLCGQTIQFQTNISLEALVLKQATKTLSDGDLQRPAGANGVMMIPIEKKGLLRNVSGIEAAKKVPLITDITISLPLHHKLVPLPEGNSYLGFIFAEGQTPKEVENAIREAHKLISFDIMPDIPLMEIRN